MSIMSWDDDHFAAWADHVAAHGKAEPATEHEGDRIAVQHLPCPTCGARKGEACRTTHLRVPFTHSDRAWVIRLAYSNGWNAGHDTAVRNFLDHPGVFRKAVQRFQRGRRVRAGVNGL